jgi:hypothetical protein
MTAGRLQRNGSKLPTSGEVARCQNGRDCSGRRWSRRGGQYPTTRRASPATASDDDAWLVEVAEGASRDAGGVPVELLGQFLPLLADAAIHGRRPKRSELDAVGLLGRRAAEQGISAGRLVQLYLSTARRLWQQLPMVVRSRDREAVRAAATAVFHVVDDGVHQVALAAPNRRLPDADAAISGLEAVILNRLGDRDVLVVTKDGLLVVLAPADATAIGRTSPALPAVNDLRRLMHGELSRLPRGRPWRVAVGRACPGLYGIGRSYEEARETLTMAGRLHVDNPVIHAHDLLMYRVLLPDQPAIVDLVRLARARRRAGGRLRRRVTA